MRAALIIIGTGFGLLMLALILSWAGRADEVIPLWGAGIVTVLAGTGALALAESRGPRPAHWFDPPPMMGERPSTVTSSTTPAEGSVDYRTYLRSPEWKAKRRAALERAGHKCQLCASRHDLEVHHNTYERLGHEAETDLMVLCDACHERFHRSGRGVA